MKIAPPSDGRDMRVRVFVLGAVFALGLFVLAANLYRLMVVRYDDFLVLSQDNQFKDIRVRAPRGQIRDRRGEILVDGRPSFDVFVTPAFCQKCSVEVLPRLGDWLSWDEVQRARVESLIKQAHGPQRYQPMVVHVDVTRDELDVLSAQLHHLPGVDVEPVPHRHYRAATAMAHVLGYMNEISPEEFERLNVSTDGARPAYALGDYIGRRGIERSFETSLRGTDGWRKEVVNARGEIMRDEKGNVLSQERVAPVPGKNVVLSIDARLQAEAEKVFPGAAGALVVLDARTGFVLAMVSRPSFDPNVLTGRVSASQMSAFAKDPMQPMVFRAVAEHYHPGSTFKPVSLLAALASGAFTAQTPASCAGRYRLGSHSWRCHKEAGHGLVHAREAMQMSCDSYFYKVGDTLGIDPIAQMGKALGLGKMTGFNAGAEVAGVMPDTAYHHKVTPGGYTKGLALNTVIGQGDVNVTPLQLAVLYAAVGNGGDVWQPQVVSRIESPEGTVLQEFAPKLTRHVDIPAEHHRVLVDSLVAVVNEPGGTAYRTRLSDVVVAGKTGTAQVAKLGSVRLKKEQMNYFERDHAWFAAFAPAHAPEIAVVVLNEHGGHGGSDAAPAASLVIRRYFELKRTDGQAFGKDWPSAAPSGPEKPKSTPVAPVSPALTAPETGTPQWALVGDGGRPVAEASEAR